MEHEVPRGRHSIIDNGTLWREFPIGEGEHRILRRAGFEGYFENEDSPSRVGGCATEIPIFSERATMASASQVRGEPPLPI
jgi:hypothetical protein